MARNLGEKGAKHIGAKQRTTVREGHVGTFPAIVCCDRSGFLMRLGDFSSHVCETYF